MDLDAIKRFPQVSASKSITQPSYKPKQVANFDDFWSLAVSRPLRGRHGGPHPVSIEILASGGAFPTSLDASTLRLRVSRKRIESLSIVFV